MTDEMTPEHLLQAGSEAASALGLPGLARLLADKRADGTWDGLDLGAAREMIAAVEKLAAEKEPPAGTLRA